jgi:DNA primase
MRAKEARDIPINEFLDSIGVAPRKTRAGGTELWYCSPIRSGDSNPSFKVDLQKNLWFDFGADKGGNIIDLVCELKHATVKDALAILEDSGLYRGVVGVSRSVTKIIGQSDKQSVIPLEKMLAGEKEKSTFEVLSAGAISNKNLIKYLGERQIDVEIAGSYLKQIRFKPCNADKSFYALGFPCGDGFEARSKLFKGFVGNHKDLAKINLHDGSSLSVFEGFMDFLAFLSFYKNSNFQSSAIILNTINLRHRALEEIQKHSFTKVYLFLDNDEAGQSTKQFFIDNIENTPVVDKSGLYKNFNDFNQMTIEAST